MDRTALLSVQRWMELYDEQPFEVVDGEIEIMHPPGRYHARLGWVIDPQTRKIKVHSPDDPEGTTLREDDVLRGEPVLPGWSMAVDEVLAKAGPASAVCGSRQSSA